MPTRPLSYEQNISLARRSKEGDETAYHELVELNLGLVHSIVHRSFWKHPHLREDFESAGYLALCRAAKQYDPEKHNPETGESYAFSSYACAAIRRGIIQALRRERDIHIPQHVRQRHFRIMEIADNHLLNTGKRLSRDALLAEANRLYADKKPYTAEEIEYLHGLYDTALSMNEPLDEEEGGDLEDILGEQPGQEDLHLLKALGEGLEQALRIFLKQKERNVLVLRIGLRTDDPLTAREVADHLGYSVSKAKELEAKALRKLRHPLARSFVREYDPSRSSETVKVVDGRIFGL